MTRIEKQQPLCLLRGSLSTRRCLSLNEIMPSHNSILNIWWQFFYSCIWEVGQGLLGLALELDVELLLLLPLLLLVLLLLLLLPLVLALELALLSRIRKEVHISIKLCVCRS